MSSKTGIFDKIGKIKEATKYMVKKDLSILNTGANHIKKGSKNVSGVIQKMSKKSIIAAKEGKKYLVQGTNDFSRITKESSKKTVKLVKKSILSVADKTVNTYKKTTEVIAISDEILEKKISNKIAIFFLLVFLWIILHVFYSFTQYIMEISYWNIFGLASVLVGSVVMLCLGWFVICDICGIVTIYKYGDFRRTTNRLIQEEKIEELKKYLLTYPEITKQQIDKLNICWYNHHNIDNILKDYTEVVLIDKDDEIDKVINQYTILSASLNTVSQKVWLDSIITMYFYFKIVIAIAKIYNIKIGVCSFVKLITFGFIGTGLSSITQKVIADSTKKVPVFGIITEGLSNGVAIRTLGKNIQNSIRPVKKRK